MAERRTTRHRQRDDDIAEEYDEDLPEDTDGQASDDAEANGESEAGPEEPEADHEEPQGDYEELETGRRPRARSKPRSPSRGRRAGLTASEVARAGLQQIVELTGKPPETVTEVKPNDDSWTVGVEVIEDRRIPSSTDLLGLYEIDIDRSGDLLSYRRVRRYSRGRGDYGED